MEKTVVVCASFILFQNDRILVEKRELTKKTDPGKVAIPGGHVENGETIEAACIREMMEELNVKPNNLEFLTKELHNNGYYFENIHYFVCTSWEGEIKSLEAEQVYWVDVNDVGVLDLEADRAAMVIFRENILD